MTFHPFKNMIETVCRLCTSVERIQVDKVETLELWGRPEYTSFDDTVKAFINVEGVELFVLIHKDDFKTGVEA
jgi:hypothetical protein